MKLLATIRASDVDPSAPTHDYQTYKERIAGRAVIFDGAKVALLHVSNSGYYTLPGGGIEGEDIPAGLLREVLEETGYAIALEREVGSAVTYIDRWKNKQIDYCYTAHVIGERQPTSHTDFETTEGYNVIWADSVTAAISLAASAKPELPDGKLVKARDVLFLRAVLGMHSAP